MEGLLIRGVEWPAGILKAARAGFGGLRASGTPALRQSDHALRSPAIFASAIVANGSTSVITIETIISSPSWP